MSGSVGQCGWKVKSNNPNLKGGEQRPRDMATGTYSTRATFGAKLKEGPRPLPLAALPQKAEFDSTSCDLVLQLYNKHKGFNTQSKH